MLNSLKNMLFTSGTAEDAAADQTQASHPVEYHMEEGEMGWLIVQRDPSGTDTQADEDGLEEKPSENPVFGSTNSVKTITDLLSCSVEEDIYSSEEEDSCSSSDLTSDEENESDCNDFYGLGKSSHLHWFKSINMSVLGESWTLAPLPCFMGTRSMKMLESNPWEDLLLEHPFKYEQFFKIFSEKRMRLENVVKPREPSPVRTEDTTNERVQQQFPQHVNGTHSCAVVLQQEKIARRQQRQQKLKASKELSKSRVQRNNKALMVQSCSKQSKRSRWLRPSGCMNSRRCQRSH